MEYICGMKRGSNVYTTLGASNHALTERECNDLYCTHPDAVVELLELEGFEERIWEPCDGLGHMSDVLLGRGYEVRRSDLFTRGREIERLDFLTCDGETWRGDVVTNPPYSDAEAFVRKALDVVEDGCKVAMWLRILFLEGQKRKKLFEELPPVRVWISSRRIPCAKKRRL